MRTRSYWAPLFLIVLGCLLLAQNLYPDFSLSELFALYWPWLLIAWGGFRLAEYTLARLFGRIPPAPMGGGSLVLALLLCLAGSLAHRHHEAGWSGLRIGVFDDWGQESFEFPVLLEAPLTSGGAVRIDGLRGGIRVVGSEGNSVVVEGRKRIEAPNRDAAGKAAAAQVLEITQEQTGVALRAVRAQGSDARDAANPAAARAETSFDLTLRVPDYVSLNVQNNSADLEIRGLKGAVVVEGERGDVTAEELAGPMRVSLNQGGILKARNLAGGFAMEGRALRVLLADVAGPVSIDGRVSVAIELKKLASPVKISTGATQLELQTAPGEIKMGRRSFFARDVEGPLHLKTRGSREIRIERFRGPAVIEAERADVKLKPAPHAMGEVTARVERGGIEVAVPPLQEFSVDAKAERGRIRHDFGPSLEARREGRGAVLRGAIGAGPRIFLRTGRGDVRLRGQIPSAGEASPGSEP